MTEPKTPRPLTPEEIDGILEIKKQWEEIGRICGGTAEVILPDDVQATIEDSDSDTRPKDGDAKLGSTRE